MNYSGYPSEPSWVYKSGYAGGSSYSTSNDISISDNTTWGSDTTTYVEPVTTTTVGESPSSYRFKDGKLEFLDPHTKEWSDLLEFELESDPFKPEPKPKKVVKAKIKLHEKLGVDPRDFEDVLF